jgi:hypothetical protein
MRPRPPEVIYDHCALKLSRKSKSYDEMVADALG